MKQYKHLPLSYAKEIITLANKKYSRYKIHKETGISKGKIRRCLESCKDEKKIPNIQQPWKNHHVKTTFSFKLYKDIRDQKKSKKASGCADEAVKIYQPFLDFCRILYNTKILNRKVKRSANEYIKEFKRAFPDGDAPSKSWVYEIAKSIHYEFDSKWLPSSKPKVHSLKSDHERKKPVKYTSIEERPNKEELRKEEGNWEIDSVIGKREDKQALLTLRDICSGEFYSRLYDRTMDGFLKALIFLIECWELYIKSLTMDNGGENNKLGEILPKDIMYNCHPYCSGEKGTLENVHRLIRRVIPKGVSLDNYTNEDIEVLNKFVNNYYSEVFNNVK